MEIQVSFVDKQTTEGTLRVDKKVGDGKFVVYQVYSSVHRSNFALKVFPKDSFGTTQYQKEKLVASLAHPNIIKHIPVTYNSPKFHTLLTEFASFGDFFELVTSGILNTEVLIRTYFHHIIQGLEHMHSQGVAHLDLKLENIVMGSDFTLKVIDFDQAQRITDAKMTSRGTIGFRGPEVLSGTCRNLVAADIYSAGIILYAFKAREYPFYEIDDGKIVQLKHYATFIVKNADFWKDRATQKNDKSYFSDEFIELVNGMLQYEPSKRFSIKQIKETKWYKGPILEGKNLKTEMENRMNALMKKKNKI